jgi:hypothetical protein
MIWLKVWQDETKWVEGLVEHVNIIWMELNLTWSWTESWKL